MSRKATSTRSDDRRVTRANHAQRDYHDRELRAKAQEMSDGAENYADDMRGGILAAVARLLSGRW